MRIATHRFIAAFSILAAALTLGALSRNVVAQEATSPDASLKQIALTDVQIESFIGAQKEMVPIIAKADAMTIEETSRFKEIVRAGNALGTMALTCID